MGMRKSMKLAWELVEDRSARLGDRHLSRNVLRNLCKLADEKTDSGDSDGLRIARLAILLGGRLVRLTKWGRRPATSYELSLGFARLAAGLRLAGRLEHADRALNIASENAPDYLLGDLYRRRAWLRIYQHRVDEAIEDATAAVGLTEGQDHALALGTLGGALFYAGEFATSIERYRQCLAELDPENESRYCGMLGSYTFALSEGTGSDLRIGLELCHECRSKLKPRHKMQRAKLWWAEGLIKRRLGKLDDAWWALDVARRSLVALQAAPEIAAIVADMAEVSADPTAVGVICTEAAEVINDPHPLTEALQALAGAARELIPGAAATLRQEASQLAACPAL